MLSLDEAQGIAEQAQANALVFMERAVELEGAHREQAEWRQEWERNRIAARDGEGRPPLDGRSLTMLSEAAYRDSHPTEWEAYLALRWAQEDAQQFAQVAAAAAQATAMARNVEAEASWKAFEERTQKQVEGAGIRLPEDEPPPASTPDPEPEA